MMSFSKREFFRIISCFRSQESPYQTGENPPPASPLSHAENKGAKNQSPFLLFCYVKDYNSYAKNLNLTLIFSYL